MSIEKNRNSNNTIKAWSEDDRPREKMVALGRQSLSDSELLAIIIGSGTVGITAVELSKQILGDYQHSLFELGKVSIKDFVKKYKGIGEAKAINIVAALELGRRRKEAEIPEKIVIKSSSDAYGVLNSILSDLPHEEFWVVCCTRANSVLSKKCIGRGGIHGVVADIKLILKFALETGASSIFVAHNHPSGRLVPSNEDKMITNKLRDACKIMDITFLDHIIIGDGGYFSFADEGI